jgi:hypothetical protein
MYITSIKMTNIRSIRELNIEFPNPAGWHVLLGDNGAGKSSIIRAISAALIGPTEILRLDPDFSTWVTAGHEAATIELQIKRDRIFDKRSNRGGAKGGVNSREEISCITTIAQEAGNGRHWKFKDESPRTGGMHPDYYNWGTGEGWFSAAFGPYRRFTGGDHAMEMHYVRNPVLGAHLTAFKENVALTESVVWLKDLQFRNLAKPNSTEGQVLNGIIHFTNQNDLLPAGFRLTEITPDGPMFALPNGSSVHLNELSEGIKSVTSLAFELMRLLLDVYTPDEIFKNFLDQDPDNDFVPVPGVVLIDEIDVHLHPIWQARIGKWFTQCFPNMQFIVTTHSPLVCRAAVNGSIWRLPDPGSNDSVEQVTGANLQQLLYGDILDAFGTGIFGATTDRDDNGKQKLQRLAELNVKFYRDEANDDELQEREKLLSLFPTYDAHFA